MATLIRNGRVLTNNASRAVHDRADILIEGEKIIAIGPDLDAAGAEGPKGTKAKKKRRQKNKKRGGSNHGEGRPS